MLKFDNVKLSKQNLWSETYVLLFKFMNHLIFFSLIKFKLKVLKQNFKL